MPLCRCCYCFDFSPFHAASPRVALSADSLQPSQAAVSAVPRAQSFQLTQLFFFRPSGGGTTKHFSGRKPPISGPRGIPALSLRAHRNHGVFMYLWDTFFFLGLLDFHSKSLIFHGASRHVFSICCSCENNLYSLITEGFSFPLKRGLLRTKKLLLLLLLRTKIKYG